MNAELPPPNSQRAETASEDADERSRWGRALLRATGLLKSSRGGDAAQRLNDFLTGEELEGDGRSNGERLMLANVLKMRDLRVVDIMVPRADIVAIDASASLEETLSAFREGAHSRLPVYRDSLDDPLGVVHLKDVALAHGFGARANDFSLSDHLRTVLAAPPSMRILALLQRMQATRRHMALVFDEYGGVDGLVTIEDVIEQIVGQIEDEHDDAEGPLWIRQADGAFLAEARATVAEFEEATSMKLLLEEWEEDVDTLGGVVFMLGGRVPERGEVIAHPLGYEFEIVDADPRRIKRLRIRPAAQASDRNTTPRTRPDQSDTGNDASGGGSEPSSGSDSGSGSGSSSGSGSGSGARSGAGGGAEPVDTAASDKGAAPRAKPLPQHQTQGDGRARPPVQVDVEAERSDRSAPLKATALEEPSVRAQPVDLLGVDRAASWSGRGSAAAAAPDG